MPTLRKIVVQDFRNIAFQEIEFSPNVNCISGSNGEGKTNLLDAIHYLSMTKSAFPVQDRYNVRYGASGFVLAGTYSMPSGVESRFSVKVSQGEKKFLRDDKPYERISDHIGLLPIVMISPGDISLVSESGEERRRFTNAVLSQMDREYLRTLQQYNRLLLQRNRLLREGSTDEGLFAVLDERLDACAVPLAQSRRSFVRDLCPIVSEYYRLISGGAEQIAIEYRTDLDKGPLKDILRERMDKDLALGYTGAGLQRDELVFSMDSHPIRRAGSQGQQKSFLVALKFAQYDIMRNSYGYAPMLLLDDVFDKLDPGRTANLIGMVAGKDFGQIFITDCNKVRLRSIVDSITDESAYFDTSAGVFTKA